MANDAGVSAQPIWGRIRAQVPWLREGAPFVFTGDLWRVPPKESGLDGSLTYRFWWVGLWVVFGLGEPLLAGFCSFLFPRRPCKACKPSGTNEGVLCQSRGHGKEQ